MMFHQRFEKRFHLLIFLWILVLYETNPILASLHTVIRRTRTKVDNGFWEREHSQRNDFETISERTLAFKQKVVPDERKNKKTPQTHTRMNINHINKEMKQSGREEFSNDFEFLDLSMSYELGVYSMSYSTSLTFENPPKQKSNKRMETNLKLKQKNTDNKRNPMNVSPNQTWQQQDKSPTFIGKTNPTEQTSSSTTSDEKHYHTSIIQPPSGYIANHPLPSPISTSNVPIKETNTEGKSQNSSNVNDLSDTNSVLQMSQSVSSSNVKESFVSSSNLVEESSISSSSNMSSNTEATSASSSVLASNTEATSASSSNLLNTEATSASSSNLLNTKENSTSSSTSTNSDKTTVFSNPFQSRPTEATKMNEESNDAFFFDSETVIDSEPITLYECENYDKTEVETIDFYFQYRAETTTHEYSFLLPIEERMLNTLSNVLLNCNNNESRRKLLDLKRFDVVKIDSKPQDEIISDGVCEERFNSNFCTIVNANMTFTIAWGRPFDVKRAALEAIQSAMEKNIYIDDTNLVQLSIYEETKPKTVAAVNMIEHEQDRVPFMVVLVTLSPLFVLAYLLYGPVRRYIRNKKMNRIHRDNSNLDLYDPSV